jgi:integrase
MREKDKEQTMNAIVRRISEAPYQTPDQIALLIKNAPGLDGLNADQLGKVGQLVYAQRLAAQMNAKVDIAGIDWKTEREKFLSDCRSAETRRSYSASLVRLEKWAARENAEPLTLPPAAADQFIRDLKAEGRAAASARRDIAAASAFYSFLERYYSAVKNPFRGTRIRPPSASKKETVIPTAADYKTIIKELPPVEKAIAAALAERGLRAGALPTLELKSGKYHGRSKGKALEEDNAAGVTLPKKVLAAIRAAGLDIKKPFADWTANSIERRINYHIGKLYKAGKIAAAYSCHDFRHYFAVKEYRKNKDIFRLSKLLNHAGIQITQVYLKSLGIEL